MRKLLLLAAIAALGEVMREAGFDNAECSWHGLKEGVRQGSAILEKFRLTRFWFGSGCSTRSRYRGKCLPARRRAAANSKRNPEPPSQTLPGSGTVPVIVKEFER